VRIDRRTGVIAAAAVLGLVVFALVPGKERSAQVRELEADPMAQYAPIGGTLADTDVQNEGISLGRPVQAELSRLFELPSAEPKARLEHARAAAAAAGWAHATKDFELAGALAFTATRQLSAGRGELTVAVYRRATLLPRDVEPPALRVTLRRLGP
jgi:hypothetical protein